MEHVNKKVCPKCLKKKSLEFFKPRPDGSAGSYCYECQLVYYREYNAKRYASKEAREKELARGKEKYEKSVKPNRLARKKKLIYMMGGKCSKCGYNKSACALDFHHINPVEKARTVSHLIAIEQEWAWALALEEIKKCELLCSNCHREETYPGCELDGIIPNEIIFSTYKRKPGGKRKLSPRKSRERDEPNQIPP